MGLAEHKFAILKIIIIAIVFLFIIGYLIVTHFRTYIINNWTTYRNNPFVVPFAGFLRKDGEKRGFIEFTKHNFKSWHWTLTKGFFSYLIKPIQYILNIITSIINGFTNTLNIFRAQAKIIRKMFADIVQTTASKMANSYSAIQYYQAKLTDLMNRQKAMFQLMLFFADSMKMTLSSLINGPVMGLVHFFPTFGIALLILIAICIICMLDIPFVSWVACPICLICFGKETPITLENGVMKDINLVTVDDYTAKGGQVISTMKFYIGGNKADVYQYRNVIVSGSHLTFLDSTPIRIADIPEARLLNKNPEYLYCLNTENNRLLINGQEYSDFHECHDQTTNQITMSLIIQALNDKKLDITSINRDIPCYQWGIAKGTSIRMKSGRLQAIENIQIGDCLEGGGEVYGIINHLASYQDVYSDGSLTVTGTQAVKKNGCWSRFIELPDVNKVEYPYKLTYNLVTRNHVMVTENGTYLADYLELMENHPVFDMIHNLNLNSI